MNAARRVVQLAAPAALLIATGAQAEPAAADRPAAESIAGDVAETALFAFRITGIERCRAGRGERARTPGGARPDAEDEPVRLAMRVAVQAHGDLFVSPRDVALEQGGVIYQSEIVTDEEKDCGRLLRPQSLRRGQRARGAVVFTVPPAVARSATLVFAPTRWGGAPRVAVAVPDCLDACRHPPRTRTTASF